MSEGEKQRVALARALVIEPRAILLDEPTASLDFYNKVKVINLIKTLHKRLHFIAIHVTHDIFEALELGQRIVYMREGRIDRILNKEKLFSNSSIFHELLNAIYHRLTG